MLQIFVVVSAENCYNIRIWLHLVVVLSHLDAQPYAIYARNQLNLAKPMATTTPPGRSTDQYQTKLLVELYGRNWNNASKPTTLAAAAHQKTSVVAATAAVVAAESTPEETKFVFIFVCYNFILFLYLVFAFFESIRVVVCVSFLVLRFSVLDTILKITLAHTGASKAISDLSLWVKGLPNGCDGLWNYVMIMRQVNVNIWIEQLKLFIEIKNCVENYGDYRLVTVIKNLHTHSGNYHT